MSEHTHNARCVGLANPGTYDGVLAWQCSDGEMRNAWASAKGAQGAAALRYAEAERMCAESREELLSSAMPAWIPVTLYGPTRLETDSDYRDQVISWVMDHDEIPSGATLRVEPLGSDDYIDVVAVVDMGRGQPVYSWRLVTDLDHS